MRDLIRDIFRFGGELLAWSLAILVGAVVVAVALTWWLA